MRIERFDKVPNEAFNKFTHFIEFGRFGTWSLCVVIFAAFNQEMQEFL